MTQVPSQTFHVNAFSPLLIPADPHWQPQPVGVPEHFLQEAPPPIDAADYPDWTLLAGLLPSGRQNRLKKCRRNALHIKKITAQGAHESLNAIACGDRVACSCCATKYAHERAWAAAQKLATVSLTSKTLGISTPVPLHVLEFRAVVPEWISAVRARGCDRSEVVSRLCPSTAKCIACEGAAASHAHAALVETELSRWVIEAWLKVRPRSGGVRHTSVRQDHPSAPIQLVITLHVPAVAAEVFPGAKISTARAVRRVFDALERAELQALCADWITFTQGNYGASAATLDHQAPLVWDEIWKSFRRTHAAPLGVWAAGLESLELVTPDVAQTFARAAGLGAIGDSGKARRVQRTTWFGIFGGRHQLEVMHAFEIHPNVKEPHAKAEVLDAVRILHKGDTHTKGQSLRDGVVRLYPNEMVRLTETVDGLGRPAEAREPVIWEHYSQTRTQYLGQVYKEQLKSFQLDADQVEIAKESSLQSPPTPRQTRSGFLKELKRQKASEYGAQLRR